MERWRETGGRGEERTGGGRQRSGRTETGDDPGGVGPVVES